jgi:acyl carrier protein
MSDHKLVERLKTILENLNVSRGSGPIQIDGDLFNQGALDSLGLIQYILALEQEFGIRIKNQDVTYENFKTFAVMARFLRSKYSVTQ